MAVGDPASAGSAGCDLKKTLVGRCGGRDGARDTLGGGDGLPSLFILPERGNDLLLD